MPETPRPDPAAHDGRTRGSVDTDAFEFDPFDPRFFDDPYPSYRDDAPRAPGVPAGDPEPPRVAALLDAEPGPGRQRRGRRLEDVLVGARARSIDTDSSAPAAQHVQHGPAPPRRAPVDAGPGAHPVPGRRARAARPRVRHASSSRTSGRTGRSTPRREYAQLIPTITMCTLMDLPASEREKFLEVEPRHPGRRRLHERGGAQGVRRDGAYWQGIVAERAERRTDDLVSQILHTPGRRGTTSPTRRSPGSARCCTTPRRTRR